MKITLKGYKVNNNINYKIVSIEQCCDEIIHNPIINLHKTVFDFKTGEVAIVAMTETSGYYGYYDEDDGGNPHIHHKIDYCPFCGAKIDIIVEGIIDVTEDYNEVDKESDKYYYKANNCDSKKEENEFRQKAHKISEKLEWWLTTDSWGTDEFEEDD